MKKILICFSLLILVQAACAVFPVQNATQTTAWTPTPDLTGKLIPGGASLYAGPGEIYPKIGSVNDTVTIIGQVNVCAWFRVLSTTDNITGWLRADQITFTARCADVPEAQIPPTPQPTATFTLMPSATFTLIPTATFTLVPTKKSSAPPPVVNKCNIESAMTIGNRTGAYATFKLVGPGIFYVSLAPDVNTTVPVCEGCYDVYIINGACGDASGTMVFRLCDGFNGWITCN